MLDDKFPQNKLKQLISDLSSHYDLTGEDIADVLWLALKQKEYSEKELQENFLPVGDNHKEEKTSNPIIKDLQSSPPQDLKPFTRPDGEKPSAPIYPFISGDSYSSTSRKTIPLRHPDPPSLQQPLEFARTLRPLMRRVDSGRRTILDELETVKRIASEGIYIPILKSESEPWLDLDLVVDENSSMIIWGNTVKELKQLLEHYGIFRKVRIWGLTIDTKGDITLKVKVGQRESFKNPQELIDPTHRRLILIVSDCVAPMWFNGTILSTLKDWTKYQPMAIVQMLPDLMWLRTGLRLGASVELVNLIPGSANRNLRIHELLIWKNIDLDRGTKIPVLTLNPESTSLWSDFVIGKYDKVMPGFVLASESNSAQQLQLTQKSSEKSLQDRVKDLDPQQRVERFRRISSPLGRKLAGLLMAAPVITLPVVRLVQKTLLPESQPVHIAEVFLGGLLKPLTEITPETNPDGVLFEVIDNNIRDILLDDAPFSDSEKIYHDISEYIEKNIGKTLKDCVGLLKNRPYDGEDEEETVEKAYARISLKILTKLGGTYARFAEYLEGGSKSEGEGNSQPEQSIEDLMRISLQSFDFNYKEIEITADAKQESQSFKFETITVNARGEVINSEQKRVSYFVESLGEDLGIEMVSIPGGTFEMGSPEDEPKRHKNESPQHTVTVQSFFMGKYLVTQAQWRFVAQLDQIERELEINPSRFEGDNLPVEKVSWYGVEEFCKRLSKYTGRKYRLPSEAEWEYACRAGTATPFYFGETITGELANYRASNTFAEKPPGEYRDKTTEVGQFLPNSFCLYDMHGNLWEWCLDDWHGNYEGAPTEGNAWVDDNQADNDNRSRVRVLRGGSWDSVPEDCRSACRVVIDDPEYRNDIIGFRVVCAVAQRILQ